MDIQIIQRFGGTTAAPDVLFLFLTFRIVLFPFELLEARWPKRNNMHSLHMAYSELWILRYQGIVLTKQTDRHERIRVVQAENQRLSGTPLRAKNSEFQQTVTVNYNPRTPGIRLPWKWEINIW